jgi:Flp pilus assembly protein TadB
MTGLVVLVFVLVFASVFGGWYVFTRYEQSADAARRRERIVGAKPAAPKDKSAKVALFEVEEQPRGRLIPTLMAKYDLAQKLRAMAEQGGVKLDPVTFVQLSLACALGGYAAGWMLLPETLRLYSFLTGIVGGALPLIRLRHQRTVRLRAFESVFPDAL